MDRTIAPKDALRLLLDGNRRYARDEGAASAASIGTRREKLAAAQRPFAVVLGCSDSRVPVEIVLDQSLGDLFVVRVAGNILSDHVIGSIEYAVEHFGSALVLVLGHSGCGAVTAAVKASDTRERQRSHVASIVDAIRPAVEAARGHADVVAEAIAQNIRLVTATLQQMPPVIASARERGDLAVVGAQYDLASGLVTVLCGDLSD